MVVGGVDIKACITVGYAPICIDTLRLRLRARQGDIAAYPGTLHNIQYYQHILAVITPRKRDWEFQLLFCTLLLLHGLCLALTFCNQTPPPPR